MLDVARIEVIIREILTNIFDGVDETCTIGYLNEILKIVESELTVDEIIKSME